MKNLIHYIIRNKRKKIEVYQIPDIIDKSEDMFDKKTV